VLLQNAGPARETPRGKTARERRTHGEAPAADRESRLTHRVLVAGSASDMNAIVAFHLARVGYRVTTVASGQEALDAGRQDRPAMIVLDTVLDGLTGYDVLSQLRRGEETRDVGVLLLTTRDGDADRVKGLSLGADDCLAKPFSPEELVLRVSAILRRVGAPGSGGGRLAAGPIVLDRDAHRVLVEGAEIALTATEFDLLHTLMQREGRVQTRPQLLEAVWDGQAGVASRTVDMHMQRLRRKLGRAGICVETVRGTGYRFQRPKVVANLPPGRRPKTQRPRHG